MDLADAREGHEVGLWGAPVRESLGPRLSTLYVEEVVARVDRSAVAVADGDGRHRRRPHGQHCLIEQSDAGRDLAQEDPHPTEREAGQSRELVVEAQRG